MERALAICRQIYDDFETKHLMVIAAGLAYYFLMSIVPALVLLTAVMAYLPLSRLQENTPITSLMIPPRILSVLSYIMSQIEPNRTGLLSLALITSVWLTSKGFKGVIAGLDIVYEVKAPRSVWVNRILAFGLAFAVGGFLTIGVVLVLIGGFIETVLLKAMPVQSLWLKIWPSLQWLLSAIVIFAAMNLLYRVAPNVPAGRRRTAPGALVSVICWIGLSLGLSFYLHHFGDLKLNLAYGIFASPIVLIVWLYWCAVAILVGAEVNVIVQKRKAAKSEPDLRKRAA